MLDVVVWLLAVELLGLLAFPLAFGLLRRLPDRGYTLSKPVGLLLSTYVLWMLGLTHLVPNAYLTVLAILLVFGVVSTFAFWRQANDIRAFVLKEYRILIVAEGLFLGFFLVWVAIISEAPAINHTEKPMDFAFLNAIVQSHYFPPEDPWLAGNPISYYYFGHMMMAVLVKLTAIPANISYNLAVALLPALVAAGSFGLMYNLVRLSGGRRQTALAFGVLAPLLVMMIGNFEGVVEFVHSRGWGGDGFWQWVGIKGLGGEAVASSGFFPDDTWWWWRATRVIDTLDAGRSLDYTITEFPFFSFILGDLHPHAMSLPFLLLNLSLGLNLLLSPARLGLGWLHRHWWEAAALAFIVGSLGFINIWDLPVMAAILGVIFLIKSYVDEGGSVQRSVIATAQVLVPIVVVGVVLFLPLYLDLGSQASGILPWRDHSTRPFLFLLVMGFFFFLGASFLLRQVSGLPRPARRDAPAILLILGITIAPFLFWAAIELLLSPFEDGIIAAGSKVGQRLLWVLPGLAIVGLAGISAVQRWRYRYAQSGTEEGAESVHSAGNSEGPKRLAIVAFPLVLLGVAFYLLVGVELFYIADLFGNRMNTVFKVYYQSWLLLSIVGAYGIYYWYAVGRKRSAVGGQRSLIPNLPPVGEGGGASDRLLCLGWFCSSPDHGVFVLSHRCGAGPDRRS